MNLRYLAILISLIAVLLLVACGGGPEEQSGDSDEPQAASSGDVSSLDEACDAFASAGGIGGLGGLSGGLANVLSGAQGGPSIQAEYSQSPPSDDAEEIADFFEDAMNKAFGGGVSAECYWEVSASQGDESSVGLWVSLELPSEPNPEVIQDIQNALTDKGATVGGFFNNPTDGDAAAMIMVGEIPLDDLEGEAGGMLMITEKYAILIASQTTGSDSSPSAPSVPSVPAQESSSADASGSVPAPAPTNTPQSAPVPQVSANVEEVIDWFKDNMEDALDVTLKIDGSLQSSVGGQNVISITLAIPEGSSIPSDVADRIEEVAESAGATITATINAGGTAIITFESLEVGGISASGTIIMAQDQNNLLVNLQY